MLVAIPIEQSPYLHGRYDAMQDEPLFEGANTEYSRGWCAFHGIENPYLSESDTGKSE